jgi:DNA helicase-2/ATP-dependent DNA helicase PcrA
VNFLENLNERQVDAVSALEGPILVLAGAGSGKTRVLTHRICHLIRTHSIRPQRILAVTFTNKATREMQERLRKQLGPEADALWVSTFHSAALRILRRDADKIGYQKDFTIYDEDDSKSVLKNIIRRLKIDEKKNPVNSFLRAIDSAKNRGITPEDFNQTKNFNSAYSEKFEIQQEVYQLYQRDLLEANAMDFGDLLLNCNILLEQETEILSFYQRLLEYILVDEFQDTNEIQYKFLKMLAAPQNNLFVVGDDDQSIYSFRGATVRNILFFDQDFKDAKVVTLDQNYRSSSNILNAAHAVIMRNSGRHKKKLWTDAEAGEALTSFVGMNEQEEAEFIADEILKLQAKGTELKDFAIFYRTNAQSRALEEALMHAHIRFKIFGGLRFYERKEIKDILGYLKLIANPKDSAAFLRVINNPPRGIGAQTVNTLANLAQAQNISLFEALKLNCAGKPKLQAFVDLIEKFQVAVDGLYLSEIINRLVEETEYGPRLRAITDAQSQSRLENLLELEAVAREFEKTESDHRECLRLFLDRVALASEETNSSKAEEGITDNFVSLMTLHLAKGLEYPIVFLTGLEEGLLPHARSIYDPDELEEERRLCYVGITRAREKLYITAAYSRGMFSSSSSYSAGYREVSRFLSDIPQELWT